MELTTEQVQEFQSMFQAETGIVLSLEQAQQYGLQVVQLVREVAAVTTNKYE